MYGGSEDHWSKARHQVSPPNCFLSSSGGSSLFSGRGHKCLRAGLERGLEAAWQDKPGMTFAKLYDKPLCRYG